MDLDMAMDMDMARSLALAMALPMALVLAMAMGHNMQIKTKDGYRLLQDSCNPKRWELRDKNGYYLMDLWGTEKEVRDELQGKM